MDKKYLDLLSRVPKNQLSQAVGHVMDMKLPGVTAKAAVSAFAKLYKINTAEAEKPLDQYKTLNEFFTRKLKPSARPIQGDLVHPADAVITESGIAADGILIQAKGITYSVESLVGDWDLSEKLHGGFYATYYLCPTDYHRVHMPADGKVVRSIAIPGTLWPVNNWSVKHVRHLFAINERLVTVIETEKYGLMVLVMVGATNVGKMTVSYDPTLITNAGMKAPLSKEYSDVHLKAGDELGTFHLGSTVICIYQEDRVPVDPARLLGPVKMGTSLIPTKTK